MNKEYYENIISITNLRLDDTVREINKLRIQVRNSEDKFQESEIWEDNIICDEIDLALNIIRDLENQYQYLEDLKHDAQNDLVRLGAE